MSRASFPQRVERGATFAKRACVIVFRIAIAIVFIPIAIAAFARDESVGGWVAIAVVFIVAPMLSPMPDD